MKVSIVTAVRNAREVVAATLDSVAGQSHAQIEHVIVDGASQDGTLDLLRSHPRRPGPLVSEPDRGVYDAFNKGWRLATGEIVAYLNAGDTYFGPDVVADVVARFREQPLDAVFGDVLIVDPADQVRVLRRYRSSSFAPWRMSWGFMPAHPALFLRRELYERLGGYDPGYRIAGDFELCLRIFLRERARYSYLPRPLVRMPRGGLSTSGWRSKWIITQEMNRACAANGVATNLLKLSARFPLKLLEVVRRGA